jgi:hypothetical protein
VQPFYSHRHLSDTLLLFQHSVLFGVSLQVLQLAHFEFALVATELQISLVQLEAEAVSPYWHFSAGVVRAVGNLAQLAHLFWLPLQISKEQLATSEGAPHSHLSSAVTHVLS